MNAEIATSLCVIRSKFMYCNNLLSMLTVTCKDKYGAGVSHLYRSLKSPSNMSNFHL